MENLKVIVSGSFKEKAMLLSIIGDALEAKGIQAEFKEPAFDKLVRDHCGDVCCDEFKNLDVSISLELENLQNTNTVEDLTALHTEMDNQEYGSDFYSDAHDFRRAITKVKGKIGQILLL